MKYWCKIINCLNKINFSQPIKVTLLLCSFFVFVSVQADALKDLSQLLQKTKSLSANFTQSISDSAGQTLSTSKGKMLILKPGYFRWQTVSPSPQLIVVKKGMVYYLQSDLQQLTIRPFNVKSTQTPAALLLTGDYTVLSKQYQAVEKEQYNNEVFILTPKAKSQLLQQITISFNDGDLQKIQLADHFNRVTSVVFSNVMANIHLSTTDFNFTTPKGTDILHD